MAVVKEILVTYKDDLNGAEYDESTGETFAFTFDGENYEIDLSEKNAAAFRKAMDKYVKAARVVVRKSGSTGTSRDDLGQIRVWAREQGFEVSDRGRVSQAIQSAYDQAHAPKEDA